MFEPMNNIFNLLLIILLKHTPVFLLLIDDFPDVLVRAARGAFKDNLTFELSA